MIQIITDYKYMTFSYIYQKAIENLWISNCLLCKDNAQAQLDICQSCVSSLPYIIHACRRCAHPLPQRTHGNYCMTCSKEKLPLYRTFPVFYYTVPINRLITRLKFGRKLVIARVLGTLMAQHMKEIYNKNQESLPQLIIPIPMHPHRLKARGFNQALEISRSISKILNISLDYTSCVQLYPVQPQFKIPFNERWSNVRDIFSLIKEVQVESVCVVDDIWSTGHTSRALAQAILNSKFVKRADIWCCAAMI